MSKNVLYEPQRETSGGPTFSKYEYQYHWALCKIIEKHAKKQEYALLVELHEDVVISDSLDGEHAQFDFYQVKAYSTSKVTTNSLTKRPKGTGGKLKSSILGKLLESTTYSPYEKRINDIGLVVASGFNFELVKPNMNLSVISKGDLSEDCISQLKQSLKEELGNDFIPENLKFIVPTLKEENQQKYVIGELAELIETTMPGATHRALDIYRAIIDDLHRKGVKVTDYKEWEDLVQYKSLTSENVASVIASNIEHPSVERIIDEMADCIKPLQYSAIKRKNLKRQFRKLCMSRLGGSSARDINITKKIQDIIDQIDDPEDDKVYFETVFLKVKQALPTLDDISEDEVIVQSLYAFLDESNA
ncbi:DUF4297 domain-containing protein [Vibrio fluvialis]|nr:DUF4297 domain-containing protein [Vibrio fluvialis]